MCRLEEEIGDELMKKRRIEVGDEQMMLMTSLGRCRFGPTAHTGLGRAPIYLGAGPA